MAAFLLVSNATPALAPLGATLPKALAALGVRAMSHTNHPVRALNPAQPQSAPSQRITSAAPKLVDVMDPSTVSCVDPAPSLRDPRSIMRDYFDYRKRYTSFGF